MKRETKKALAKVGPGQNKRPKPVEPPAPKKAAPVGLDAIVALAENALKLEERIKNGEELLKQLREQHRAITENDLPEAMDALDVEEFKLANGRKVTITQSFHPNISEDHRPLAFEWLRKRGHDGIIKRHVSVEFGKGEDKIANRLLMNLRKYKTLAQNSIKDREQVHPQTLKSFVKEMIETGEDLPMDLFGVHVRRSATIK